MGQIWLVKIRVCQPLVQSKEVKSQCIQVRQIKRTSWKNKTWGPLSWFTVFLIFIESWIQEIIHDNPIVYRLKWQRVCSTSWWLAFCLMIGETTGLVGGGDHDELKTSHWFKVLTMTTTQLWSFVAKQEWGSTAARFSCFFHKKPENSDCYMKFPNV